MTNIGASNGLLRDYFPKGTDLSIHSEARLAEVQAEINDRPRKTLDWATPAALITQHLQVPEAPLLSTLKTVVVRR